jgi:NTP pyrophosphatase (non-canonical NTP hydrolase)
MNLNQYFMLAKGTAVYPNIGKNYQYALIGLGGEVGELMNVIKKISRDDNSIVTQEKKDKIIDELGDIMWYYVMLCYEFQIDPDVVLTSNILKLKERQRNNTLHDKGRVQQC